MRIKTWEGLVTDHSPMPAGLRGNPRLLRISASLAGQAEDTCPDYTAAKARPAVSARFPVRYPKARLEDFPLARVQKVLDRVEFGGDSIDSALQDVERCAPPLHDMQRNFVRHAARSYLANQRPQDAPPVVPCRHEWAVRGTKGDRTWESTAWGRQYHDPATGLREFRFLVLGQTGEQSGKKDRPAAQIAHAAHVAAFGQPAERAEWNNQPYRLLGAETVNWVRVAEVGLMDGSYELLFEGTPEQARAYFAEHAKDRITSLVRGGRQRPGASCLKCKLLTSCDALPKTPGLLGLPSRRSPWPLRKVSVSDLRYHSDCPGMAFGYSSRLPRANEYSLEAQLGKAVHWWLERNHRHGAGECNAFDMPMADHRWGEDPYIMSGEWARIGSQMLGWHLDICPFNAGSITDVSIESDLAFHDTSANVVVVAKPDMLFHDNGAVVWREIKTTQRDSRYHDDPLDAHPQLALATVLLADGHLGGDLAGARVELETLRPDSANLECIEPFHEPERVAKARRILHDLAEPWRSDEIFTARPTGRVCGTCPVSQWCSSALGGGR
ncbi:PD-(D/E)XK nuclease family protein [Lentzea sp. NEAU-D7]|uniref:PD-(D/E)XK nuclease family protein n=1 Tax=Lentzea sp. NEAU-D7 TaxID=2994667 RepID=UPI00224B6BA8|nr:PD-(D/E)XK nuclease family protein [Lentzea sp. NEAU-D7]MCX2949753.1 PD-(D/E)XK nuclease family protein [Lentzea sp. NEAU-D7]